MTSSVSHQDEKSQKNIAYDI